MDELRTVDELLKQVPGFGRCPRCKFSASGSGRAMFRCARRTMEPLAASRCPVCDRPYRRTRARAANPLCNRDDRWFSWNFAISMRTGELKGAINRYKYTGSWGWA